MCFHTKFYYPLVPLCLGIIFALIALAFSRPNRSVQEVYSDGSISLSFQSLPEIKAKKIPAGEYMMGASATDRLAIGNEFPAHHVHIKAFNLSRYEVTQELWEAVMNSNPSSHVGPKFPVENVSWNDCQEFIARLNQHPDIQSFNYHFRLPSEAEWEYVASGASQGLPFQRFAGSDNAQIVAWFATNSDGLTHEVGQLQDVAPGIYDLSGNVSEWVQDRYCEYSSKEQKNPVVTSGPSVFVYRGGSFRSSENKLRVTARNADTASYRSPDLGFRLVIEQY